MAMRTDVDAQSPEEETRYQAVLALRDATAEVGGRLIAALYDPSWRVRKLAAERLGALRDPNSIIPDLLAVLGDRGETGARNAAAEALSRMGSASTAALIAHLRHPDPDQRKFAADILGQMGASVAQDPLIAALEDVDPNVRVAAAEALGQVGGAAAARALDRALGVDDALLRLAALESLIRLRSPPPLPELLALAEQPALARAATRALGLIAQPAALSALVRALGGSVRPVREAALAALGLQVRSSGAERVVVIEQELLGAQRREPRMVEWLEQGLALEDVDARRGAVFALGQLRHLPAATLIAESAEDERLAEDVTFALVQMGPAVARAIAERLERLPPSARMAATEALIQLAEPGLVAPLSRLLGSSEADLQLLTVKALGRSRSVDAISVLSPLFSNPGLAAAAGRALIALAASFPAQVRAELELQIQTGVTPTALRALATVAGPDALPVLQRALRDPAPGVRAASAEALAHLRGREGADLLRMALADEAVEVRAAATRALSELPVEDATPLLRLALSDPDPEIVAAAVDAAAEVGAADVVHRLVDLVGGAHALTAVRALRALSRLGQVTGIVLERATAHPDPEVAREAVLVGAAVAEGVPLALRMLSHARWDVRAAAARALAASAGAEVLPEVDGALAAESDPLVREALADARDLLARR